MIVIGKIKHIKHKTHLGMCSLPLIHPRIEYFTFALVINKEEKDIRYTKSTFLNIFKGRIMELAFVSKHFSLEFSVHSFDCLCANQRGPLIHALYGACSGSS